MRTCSPVRLAGACVLSAAALGVVAPSALADWTRPFDLSSPIDQAANASVGVSSGGSALYAWDRNVGGGIHRVEIRNRSAAGVLGAVTGISSSRNADRPSVEINGGGAAVILYEQFDSKWERLAVNGRSSSGTVGAQQLVSGSGSSVTGYDGGIDTNGRALLVWRNEAGVRARFRAADGTLGATTNLSNSANDGNPQVAVSPSGHCVVTWQDDFDVHVRSCSTTTSTFGADKIAQTNITGDPDVGISDAGRAVLVWSRTTDTPQIESRVLTTTGTIGSLKTIESGGLGVSLSDPRVAVDSDGLAAIAYKGEESGDGGIIDSVRAAVLPTSNNPTPPVLFSRDGQETGAQDVAIDNAGRAEVIWPVFAGVNSHITSRSLAPNGTAGTRVTVSDLGNDIDQPAIAKNATGAAAADWSGNNEDDDVVQGAFEAAP